MDNHLNGQNLERLVVIWILLTKWNYGGRMSQVALCNISVIQVLRQ